MKVLAVSWSLPYPDEASGDLRFFTLLSELTAEHRVSFIAIGEKPSGRAQKAVARLERQGITVHGGALQELLSKAEFDVVLLESYSLAAAAFGSVRTWQPKARMVVDSIDVHFHRLRSQARVSGLAADAAKAEQVRGQELAIYGRSDLVIAVSDADRDVLASEGLRVPMETVPNIHAVFDRRPRPPGDRLELLFIGGYKHPPNIDAAVYFCTEVLPLLKARVPRVRVRLVGSHVTPEVQALASDSVEVVGYVEDTSEFLYGSHISIAPLRFGGGIKGKVGEAMAHGIPVVTTTVGAEGFGLQEGRDLLVADTPEAFADAICTLWEDPAHWETVRNNGWAFIRDHYSVEAVRRRLPAIMERIMATQPARMRFYWRWYTALSYRLEKFRRGPAAAAAR